MEKIFDIAGSSMSAQQVRLNLIASNMANANNVAKTPDQVYKAKIPVFEQILGDQMNGNGQPSMGVKVATIAESNATIEKRFQPGHPLADEQGYVYATNVNPIEQLADMMSASRSYETSVEIMNTAKTQVLRALDLLRS